MCEKHGPLHSRSADATGADTAELVGPTKDAGHSLDVVASKRFQVPDSARRRAIMCESVVHSRALRESSRLAVDDSAARGSSNCRRMGCPVDGSMWGFDFVDPRMRFLAT